MRLAWVLLLLVWVHIGDLATAWLYGGGAWPAAAELRMLRDILVLGMAVLCVLSLRLPREILLPTVIFAALVCVYMPVGYLHGLPAGVVVRSAGTLAIPMLFVCAGYVGVRDVPELRRVILCLVCIALASTVFGMWEIRHTEFWEHTVQFPAYMIKVKGVLKGLDPVHKLPWSFVGGEDLSRRAAGLLAAPLAQGALLAVAALCALALWQRRAPWRSLGLCAFLYGGIWMSGTRGAILLASIALFGYVITAPGLLRSLAARVVVAAAFLAFVVFAAWGIVDMSIHFRDGSTIGHWHSLLTNLQDFGEVWLLGGGIGRQGAIASQEQLADLGGGEGAFFTIAYQMGLPAALVFMWFYFACMRLAHRAYRVHGLAPGLALYWLGWGFMVTLVSSDHVFSVSGSAALWLLFGALMRCAAASGRRLPVTAREPGQ